MTIHFIGAGPGDPELITIKGQRLITQSPVCLYAGSLVPEAVIAVAPKDADIHDTASMTLDEIIQVMQEAADKNFDVARVHSGDPSLYGAIGEQMLAIHLSIRNLRKVRAAVEPSYGSDCPVAVVYRASWPDQKIIRGTLATIEEQVRNAKITRTALILIGPVLAAENFSNSALYNPSHAHLLRPSTRPS